MNSNQSNYFYYTFDRKNEVRCVWIRYIRYITYKCIIYKKKFYIFIIFFCMHLPLQEVIHQILCLCTCLSHHKLWIKRWSWGKKFLDFIYKIDSIFLCKFLIELRELSETDRGFTTRYKINKYWERVIKRGFMTMVWYKNQIKNFFT